MVHTERATPTAFFCAAGHPADLSHHIHHAPCHGSRQHDPLHFHTASQRAREIRPYLERFTGRFRDASGTPTHASNRDPVLEIGTHRVVLPSRISRGGHAQHSPRDAATSRPPFAMVPPRWPRAKIRAALEWPVPCALPAAAARAPTDNRFDLSAATRCSSRAASELLLQLLRARKGLLPRRHSNHRPRLTHY